MKVMFGMAGLFVALAAIPLSVTAQECARSTTFFPAGTGDGYSCCAEPFCCDGTDPNPPGCQLANCNFGNNPECPTGQVTVNCIYASPPTCTNVRPLVGCQCGCLGPQNCAGFACPVCDGNGNCSELQCAAGEPRIINPVTGACSCGCAGQVTNCNGGELTCPVCNPNGTCGELECGGLPRNKVGGVCFCGCNDQDINCLGGPVPLSCPFCKPDGTCESRDCGSASCCKATRGNDLVCANGCGRRNVCWRVDPNLTDAVCEYPAACLASEFEPDNLALNTTRECFDALGGL